MEVTDAMSGEPLLTDILTEMGNDCNVKEVRQLLDSTLANSKEMQTYKNKCFNVFLEQCGIAEEVRLKTDPYRRTLYLAQYDKTIHDYLYDTKYEPNNQMNHNHNDNDAFSTDEDDEEDEIMHSFESDEIQGVDTNVNFFPIPNAPIEDGLDSKQRTRFLYYNNYLKSLRFKWDDPDYFYSNPKCSKTESGEYLDEFGQVIPYDQLIPYFLEEKEELEKLYINKYHLYQNAIIGGTDFNDVNINDTNDLPQNSNETFYKYENSITGNNMRDTNDIPFKDGSLKINKTENISLTCPVNHTLNFFRNNVIEISKQFGLLILALGAGLEFIPLNQSTLDMSKIIPTNLSCKFDKLGLNLLESFINHIQIGTLFNEEVLGIAFDTGEVFVYYMRDINDNLNWNKSSLTPDPEQRGWNQSLPEPAFLVYGEDSVWGLDFYDDILVVSDNSHSITLFQFENMRSSNYYHITSLPLQHNIPSVSILKDKKLKQNGEVYVAAVTISGEVIMMKFKLKKNPSDSDETVSSPFIESRYDLGPNESGWTVDFVRLDSFKTMSNIKELTGNQFIDQQDLISNKLLNNSKALDIESDPCYSSHMGFATYFHEFKIHTMCSDDDINNGMKETPHLSTTLKYRRVKKFYEDYFQLKQKNKKKHISINGKNYWEPIPIVRFNDYMLFVTSAKKTFLFRPNKLILNAYTPQNLFKMEHDYSSLNLPRSFSPSHLNRMSLSLYIPELNSVVVVSQVGYASVMRLTKHRGLVAFKEEVKLTFNGSKFSGEVISGLSYFQNGHGHVMLLLMSIRRRFFIFDLSIELNKMLKSLSDNRFVF